MFAYLTSYFISSLLASNRCDSIRSFANEWMVLAILSGIATRWTEKRRRFALYLLFVILSIVSVYAAWQFFSGVDLYRARMLEPAGSFFIATGVFGQHLTFGTMYMMLALFAFGIFASEGRFSFPSGILATVSVVVSFARSAWLGFVAGIVSLAFCKKRKVAFLFFILFLVAVLIFLFPSLRERVMDLHFGEVAVESRITLLRTAFNMFKAHPFFGIGAGNFSTYFDEFYAGGVYDNTCHPHNDYLNILASGGIFTFVPFISIFILFFVLILRRMKSSEGLDEGIALGSLSAVVGFLVASFFQCNWTDAEVGEFVVFLLGFALSGGER
ncbi:O-antigen ligase family protein [bacterium]|nr:O-antigen ligase family protein [bacterium]